MLRLPAPKNHFWSDVLITSDAPMFATHKHPTSYKGAFTVEDECKTEMIRVAGEWYISNSFVKKGAENTAQCALPSSFFWSSIDCWYKGCICSSLLICTIY